MEYDGANFQFTPSAGRLAIKGNLTYAGGVCTSTKAQSALGDLDARNGLVIVYGYDGLVQYPLAESRVRQVRHPYAALLETGAGVDYVSAANDAGCVKCHTDPYLKHGNIYAQVNRDPATDFYTCKACHLDDGAGSHFDWQLLVDDPELAAAYLAKTTTPEQNAQIATKYAYKTRLMNDVHMSHAMEFPYPQSMANCATCHEGKLDTHVLTDANFTFETCRSCHAVTGPGSEKQAPALTSILPQYVNAHQAANLGTPPCNSCHNAGSGLPVFNAIHTGYDKKIYADALGTKYSDAITVSIDSASFADNQLTFAFSAAENPDIAGLAVTDIAPTVMVGLYGWNTKDYLFGPHERTFDDNGDGVVSGSDKRNLEFVVGEVHPRFTTVSAANGSWEVTANLAPWADKIADGTVKRAEIAVMPRLQNADNVVLALNAPSRTFDLSANAFDDGFLASHNSIVKVETGCNNCHDALATTFHSADRGGNIVVCRMCHITKNGGSHLEMQSRSIDSYAHAIHSFQPFDIGDIDFADPVAAMHYEHHIGFPYPTHGITNCESCHNAGTYNVPDQSKSLPGVLSRSDTLKGRTRSIGSVPSYVTGPASRACGSCHRAQMINEEAAGELAAFNQHTRSFGYLVENGDVQKVIDDIMANFAP